MTSRSSMPAPETSSPTLQNIAVVESDESDEDDAFMRNKPSNNSNRWKEIQLRNERAKKANPIEISDSSSSASDGDGDGTPKPKKKKGKSKPKAPVMPAWTRRPPKTTPRLITSSDEDEIVVLQDRNAPPSGRDGSRVKGKNRKRSRSRSCSLTPPPELTAEEKARAKAIVEGALHNGPPTKKQKTPPINMTDLDLEFSSGALNPELAMIAKRVMARPAASSKPGMSRMATDTIKARVQWVSHPADDPLVSVQQWTYTISRSDTFATSLLPHIVLSTGAADVVLSYDGKRVFRTSTPESLGIWSDADFRVCTPHTWEYITTHRDELPDSIPETPATAGGHDEATPGPSEDEHDVEDSFTLILRAQNTKDVHLRVKPTATAAKVIAAYLKKVPQGATLTAAKKKAVHLVFEGDKVAPSTTLASLDLEDEDVLDVRGI